MPFDFSLAFLLADGFLSPSVALTAPEAKIMPIRVLDRNGEGELWRVQSAIIWALNHGADVINMSMSFPADALPQDHKVLKRLFDFCDDGTEIEIGKTYPTNNNKCIMVTGSGNGGNANKVFPAALKAESVDILSVGASTRYDRLATFSSINVAGSGGDEWVRFVAPGENIISAMPGGRYGMWSGTSMSSPVVAGIAALVKAKFPNMTTNQLFEHLENKGIKWNCTVQSRSYIIDTTRIDALCALTDTGAACARPPNRTVCPE